MPAKPTVAFICVHNACRSQIAEALGKLYGEQQFNSCSAGTDPKPVIDATAVRLIKTRYGIDMSSTQSPKTLLDLPPVDIVVTMGCGVQCPALPARWRFDWDLDDPTGKDDAVYLLIIDQIAAKMTDLIAFVAKQKADLQ